MLATNIGHAGYICALLMSDVGSSMLKLSQPLQVLADTEQTVSCKYFCLFDKCGLPGAPGRHDQFFISLLRSDRDRQAAADFA